MDHLILDFFLSNHAAYRNWYRLFGPESRFRSEDDSKRPAPCLYYACLYGLTLDVEALLLLAVDVNACGGDYHYALIAAAAKGHLKVVELLLAYGADPDLTGDLEQTALHCAARAGYENIVRVLLNANADIDALDIWHVTVLGSACEGGHISVVQLLLDKGAKLDPIADNSALGPACFASHERIVCWLSKQGDYKRMRRGGHASKSYKPVRRGCHTLMSACRLGYKDLVEILLDKGADVNSSEDEHTALQAAISNGHTSVAFMLIVYGANVKMVPECANFRHLGQHSPSPLLRAYQTKNWALMKALLHNGADANSPAGTYKSNDSVVEVICLANDASALRMLLDWDIDVNIGLPAACSKGHLELAQIILDSGVSSDVHSSNYGYSLEAAAYGGNVKLAHLLLERNASVNTSSELYGSPLVAASGRGDHEMVGLLIRYGANANQTVLPCSHQLPWGRRESAIEAAASIGHEDIVRLLLAASDGGESIYGNYDSALKAASLQGHKTIVSLLLESTSDTMIANDVRLGMALSAATSGGQKDVVRMILEERPHADLSQGMAAPRMDAVMLSNGV
ncbi:hypothetical protein KCU67_g2276, partial [Aureobasidium melanogenum]